LVTWTKQRVLITVRTYPVPARSGIEVSCTAGVTDQGRWIRLFPVPYRFLEMDQRFKKYQWIEVDTMRAPRDSRPESHMLRAESIKIGDSVEPGKEWRRRRDILRPLMGTSFCELQRARDRDGFPTLGIIKPTRIRRLLIEKTDPAWTSAELSLLNQQDMFLKNPVEPLEKLPFIFKYDFDCIDVSCKGHSCTCTDCEMGQSFRKWQKEYGDGWEQAFRKRYETEMSEKFDTYFYVGNLHQYPNAWIVVGLFYPPRLPTDDLFG